MAERTNRLPALMEVLLRRAHRGFIIKMADGHPTEFGPDDRLPEGLGSDDLEMIEQWRVNWARTDSRPETAPQPPGGA